MTEPGWYPVGDGLFEAYWDGSTWTEGSRRPIPPSPMRPSWTIATAQAWCERCGASVQVDPDQPTFLHPGCENGGDTEAIQNPRYRPAGGRDSATWWLVVIGGLLGGVSAFLPWMSGTVGLTTISRNAFQMGDNSGFSATGVLLLVIGLLVAITGAASGLGKSLRSIPIYGPVTGGVFLAGDALLHVSSINGWADGVRSASDGLASANIGFGLWVAVVAGLLCFVAGVASTNWAREARIWLNLNGIATRSQRRG